jgi:acid phosphatase
MSQHKYCTLSTFAHRTKLFASSWVPLVLALFLWQPTAAQAKAAPTLDHVIVVIMENHSYSQVAGASYISSLIAGGTLFTNSYGVTHPSQPNYLALWSGSTQGVTNDNCPSPGQPYSTENLGHACEAAGVSWRAYSEDLPAVGSTVCTANSSLYARKHEPWTDFSNLDHTHERPFADLASDIAAGTLPRLSFVVPNQCNDMHNCSVATGDAWLAANLPALLSAVGPRGMVVLTWDEDDSHSGNHILTVFAGPAVQAGQTSTQHLNHYTVLRCLCEALGLTPFGAAASEISITGVWSQTVAAQSTGFGGLKARFR